MHRRSTTQSLRASSSPDVASFRQPEKPGEADFAWFQCGCWLVAGGLLPSLLACYYYKEVLTVGPLKRLVVFLTTDLVFAATSYVLILEGQRFGRNRNPGMQLQPYPGPWVELSGQRRFPQGFKKYLMAMPAAIGLLMPAAVLLASVFLGDDRLLLATCAAPYLLTLLSQIWMEGHFVKQGTYMWPMVPIIHMYYRMTQLGRAFALNAAMSGPSYIFIVLALLAFVWVFNIAAVIVWMPWLYCWQYQPTKE
ncbi:hypothetical protein CVIRNUC_009500 [Coccomyxa viridis]|uniref:Uncharacterized protein n=1 Tax=Coccomyxa viridis TaxID=1274662 RepID=A0AAV1IGL0_9CHLO|nr:hypothetical protein CVIRNUC_009500 [Coccomyxa viridis]